MTKPLTAGIVFKLADDVENFVGQFVVQRIKASGRRMVMSFTSPTSSTSTWR